MLLASLAFQPIVFTHGIMSADGKFPVRFILYIHFIWSSFFHFSEGAIRKEIFLFFHNGSYIQMLNKQLNIYAIFVQTKMKLKLKILRKVLLN